MVRVPRCEKMALIKKGPWSIEEDQILINHIQNYGHANWRALPKQAGLLRCGKSCRLRWINYLRPDIKRGNFTREEEDAIIHLHQLLGNRWSAMAAKLPGRTDNEIKNVWHTHLKKRLKQRSCHKQTKSADNNNNNSNNIHKIEPLEASNSNVPMKSCSGENSSSTTSETNLSEIDKSLWSSSEALFSREEEALLIESSSNPFEISEDLSESNLLSPFDFMNNSMELSSSYDYSPNIVDDLNYFWYNNNNNNNSNNILKIESLEASNSNVPMKSCSGENSSSTTSETNLFEIDKSLWSSSEALFSREGEALLIESSSNPFEISEDLSESNLLSPFNFMNNSMELSSSYDYNPNIVDDLDYFWYNVFIRAGEQC